ncbi:L,D-transpeptidase family protein [Caldovatus aquaticus]|uniref:L,D-transpeptidase family protein n=1 Tax=Caldovatus aquaticus TaxID=2865671 RepID=A0ABS7EX48_9PROT|nr:L,D-transpeptidase family protein [Caldovatus aquaticus]
MKLRSLLPLLAVALAGSVAAPPPTLAGSAPPASQIVPTAEPHAGREALLRLRDRLQRLEEDGLDPAHYDIPPAALAASDPEGFHAALLRAAAAALEDLLHGRVRDPLPGRADLQRDPAAHPLAPWLAELATAAEPAAVIERAATLHPDAPALRRALARLRARAAAGGYPVIPPLAGPGDTIEPGSADPRRIPLLRARLGLEEPALVAGARAADPHYDGALVAAVKRFQAAEGLEPDGRIGRLTLEALNRPIEARIRQLRVALDMRRGLAPPPAGRRIEVNVPDYRLRLIGEDGRVALEMAVVVGRRTRPTPMLRAQLTAVMFNPPWGVPQRNAREDLLPRLRRDPRAVMEKGFRIFAYRDGERVEIDPTTVNWHAVSAERFPYVIRQDAGDANALGRIKFIMPNSEDIFLHDTPERHLFRRADRAFSSGCIRLERPMELLEAALSGTPGWDRARAERAIAARSTSVVQLARGIPVLLHYTTVTVEEGDGVRVRPDIYGLDEAYARALDAPHPSRRQVAAAGSGGPTAIPASGR